MTIPPPNVNRRLLVVDDDGDIREVLTAFLETKGYTVIEAANGLEALGQLKKGGPPCAILLDFCMPVMDAGEFLAQKSSDPVLAPIPVVLLTGADDDASHAAGLRATALVRKPIDPAGLLSAIERCCRCAKGADLEA